MTMTTEKVFEQRDEHQILTRFDDDRLARLFAEVWRGIPADAREAVYANLGAGAAMLVTDNISSRPSHFYGQSVRVVGAGHIRVHLDYFNLTDQSAKFCRAIAAHELANIVLGHLGPAEAATEPILTVLAHVDNTYELEPTGAAREQWNRQEAEATKLAARWGFAEPTMDRKRK